jgi:hypothetical protein
MIGACRRLQSYDPVAATLQMAGMAHLMPIVTHMFYPNNAPSGNRHYCYKRGVGWVSDIVTLSRPSVKYDVINGQLVTIPAGVLGANGRIEPQCINLAPVLSGWTWVGADAITSGIDDPLGGTTAVRLNIHNGATEVLYKALTKPEATYLFTCWIRSPSITGMRLGIDDTPAGISISSDELPVTPVWTRVSALITPRAGKTVSYLNIAQGYNGAGFLSSQTGVLDIAFPNFSVDAYMTSTIPTAATRAADAWSVALSGMGAEGSALVIVRQPAITTALTVLNLLRSGPAQSIYVYPYGGTMWLQGYSVSQYTDLGAVAANVPYSVAFNWGTGFDVAINGVEKTPTTGSASFTPTSLELGAEGSERPLVMFFDRKLTVAERAALSGTALRNAVMAGL